ncbi:MAG: DNA-binding transcriptional regulator [Rhodobacteraceae bacterium]|jgi:DNA-binding transcriptional regulator LsrR (DeoR family)|uniref:Transcriptional regulator with sigma factor-related N-terminal domain n=1 Tax=Salipiger profundus TaxID=1229727 RepID=A0A1U7DBB5_9RHOB|nr:MULTISPECIES: sugar-binding transcriptional regulator [Salipiger]APX25345.1 transcriptional regulator with sigma factor-related N-terminal domain [Salipiger profundus]MAB05333.1 DNA-binding transcriptional regulator [Paracoccaceae bacterium]GGA24770.1 DNA-binding transcriptional regulator [Salipiger profundus]SFD85101.1 DNA-binding transcriptional regulator LsrR, DeoR family [Salipiger profundus]
MADDSEVLPQDIAARAAWLYYVGGLRQDQIAQELGISRQRAQRMVARAMAEGLVRVRIDHPIAECLDLERALRRKFGLSRARVAPRLGPGHDALRAIAPFAAPEVERIFREETPKLVGLGTGRTLRAVIEEMQTISAKQHKMVSLIGNVSPDGSASFYEVIMRAADKTGAPHYPMSVPVVARDAEEFAIYRALPHVQALRKLAAQADITIVGIGQMADDAPLFVDGFITEGELKSVQQAGAAGELCGYIFDSDGQYLDHPVNDFMVGCRVPVNDNPVMCIGGGVSKIKALRAALKGNLIDELITDELTAAELISS